MGDGLLLSLPTESVAVRVALASVVAVVAARALSRGSVRTSRARASLALIPAAAMLVVLGLSLADPSLPSVWHTVDAAGGLTVPVRNTYLSFAPATLPLVLGTWAVVATVRVAVRTSRHALAVRELRQLAALGDEPPPRVVAIATRLAAALRTSPPEVAVVPSLPGGAAVVGVRAPLLVVDSTLLRLLDDEELAGVLAHELAHVQRRDNLVALALGLVRDVLFFVPGGGWSLSMLLREREHAADAVAADVTARPGALAGGLLKVLELRGRAHQIAGCSALLSGGTLVERVEALCDDRPAPSRSRRTGEGAAVAAAAGVAVLVAVAVPSLVAGPAHQRDALGVLLADVQAQPGDATTPRAAVFRAFDGHESASATVTAAGTTTPGTTTAGTTTIGPTVVEPTTAWVNPFPDTDDSLLATGDLDLAGVSGYAACARGLAPCGGASTTPRVSLPPQPIVRVDDRTIESWRLEPIVRSTSQERALFWFSRLEAS